MPSARLVFPRIIQDPQNGHWMHIKAVGRGSDNTPLSTVTLFIPGGLNGSNMVWTTRHDYQEAKMAKIALGGLSAIPVVGVVAAAIAGAAPMAGGAINPKVEVLYRNTELRTFQFSFIMAPSSNTEAKELKEIVRNLRSYSSPTLVAGKSDPQAGYVGSAEGQSNYLSSGGSYFSPNEFLIQFYYVDSVAGAIENDNIPKIGRCVLENIEINYTPQGEWSTFHDGHPTSAMLTMVFREMRIIDGANILDGY